MELHERLRPHRRVTVVGLAKNAGKTTIVNHLLERLDGPVGLVSLGLDGEARDQLTGLPKPRVTPPPGSLVATTSELAGDLPVRRRLGFRTAVGEVVLVEPSPGQPVIVSGPTRIEELDATVELLFAEGVRRVLLEGALGRLGTAAPGRADAVVLAAGASLANGHGDLELKLKLAIDALDLPPADGPAEVALERTAGYESEAVAAIGDAGSAEVSGALTGPLLEGLMRAGRRATVIVADPSRVLARPQQIARARRAGVTVHARAPLAIAAVTSNPFHPDVEFSAEQAFAATVAAVAGRWPVHDVISGMISA